MVETENMNSSPPAWKFLADHLETIVRHRAMAQTPPGHPSLQIGQPKPRRKLLDARAALAKATFEAAMTRETCERLKRGKGVVAIVTTPSPNWVLPISTHIATIAGAKRIARDGSHGSKDSPSEGNEEVLAALAAGRSVVGISQAPDRYLPSVLASSADATIHVAPPDGAVIARAIANCLRGRFPKNVPQNLGEGLDFNEIVAALRPGSTPADAVQRLQMAAKGRAAAGTPKLPTLDEAVFYGEARTWGLDLAADVEEAKKSGDWSGVDRGAIFFGPSGTGKTFLARIIAAACKLPLIEASVADLFASSNGFLDGVIKAQRALFAKAAAQAPCCVLWDEIEAMPARSKMSPRGRDFWLPAVDDFMLCVASAPRNVILLGCTNHIDLVEESLLRPGRMERAIEVRPAATAEGLVTIIRFHLGDDLVSENLLPLARMALGVTAAEVMEMVRRARRMARTAKRALALDDLAAIIAPPDDRPEHIRVVTARHEAAHAVITLVLGVEDLKSVSIVRSGSNAGGNITVRVGKALELRGRSYFEDVAVSTLAGRAAEVLLCGGATAGAGGDSNSDLGIVTRIITAIHASLGLGEALVYRGEPTTAALESMLLYDPALRAVVDADMKRLHKRAEDLVLQHRREIETVAHELLKRRHLEADEVRRIIGR